MQNRAERGLGSSLRSHVLSVVSYIEYICRLRRLLVTSCLGDNANSPRESRILPRSRLCMVGPVRTRKISRVIMTPTLESPEMAEQKPPQIAENRLVQSPEPPEQLGCVPASEHYLKSALVPRPAPSPFDPHCRSRKT